MIRLIRAREEPHACWGVNLMRKLTMMVMVVVTTSVVSATQASACGTRPFGWQSRPAMQIRIPTPAEIAGMFVAEQARVRHEARVETGIRIGRWTLGVRDFLAGSSN